jgi:hypothetical protein
MSDVHAPVIETLDETASTATISLKGLGIFCFNEQGAFEGAFVRRPTHAYIIEIKEQGDASSKPQTTIFEFDGDVDIQVLKPVREGARRYQKGDFDRSSDANDMRDFRWIVDMEGPELHDEPMSATERRPTQSGTGQLSRLTINAGTFYAKRVSQETYALVRLDDGSVPPRFFGSVCEDVGAEIECADAETDEEQSGLLITLRGRRTQQQVLLPRIEGLKYEIIFSNDCPDVPGERPDGSDFRIFYDVIRDSYSRRFDLAFAVDPDDPRAVNGVPLDEAATKFKDKYGLVCNKVYLGRTSTLSHLS